MAGEGGAARALFERFLKEKRTEPELEFDAWLENYAEHSNYLRTLYNERCSSFFRPTNETPSEPPLYAEGETLDDFRLIERIGAGGMGEVWKAEQQSVGRFVALKLIRRDRPMSDRQRKRFQREAVAGGRLNHPHIASVYTVGESDGRPYLVQELVEGGCSLADFIDEMRLERLPSDYFIRVAEFFAKILDALQAAHDAGVIHRDLKPQNILVTKGDEPKVVDFGLARVTDTEPLSRTGDFVGTYCYMSPEQALSRRIGIDHRTDVFSAGATFYEVLTFSRAFDGGSTHEVTEKILYQDPPEARTVEHRVPHDLSVICAKALEKRRQDRYATMTEFADELRRYLNDEPIIARPATRVQKAVKWSRRHPGVCATLAVGLMGLLSVLWLASDSATLARARTDAERDTLYTRAQYALEMNDLDGAVALIREAAALDPGDVTGHLILAQGFAKFSRVAEMEQQIYAAIAKGFSIDGSGLEAGIDHLAFGLYLMSSRDPTTYPRAEEHLREALALDSSLYSAHYSLYQLHSELGQFEAALEDLSAFQGHLATGNPFYVVAEALEAELTEDYERACTLLEGLKAREDVDEKRLVELRYARNLGRNYLQLGDLDRAEELLREAALEERDCWSKDALATLCLERYRADQSELRWLEEMRAASSAALECSQSLRNSRVVAAYAAVELFGKEPTTGSARDKGSWTAANMALESFAGFDETDVDLARLRSRLFFLEAAYPLARNDHAAAERLLGEALEANPVSLRARALLGQVLWNLERYAEGQDLMRDALAYWDQPGNEGRWRPKWLGALLVWSYGCAAANGDVEEGASLRRRIEAQLSVAAAFEESELLTLAEFLATSAHAELRDCALALEIVERFDLRTAFLGGPLAGAAADILALVDRECP
jgi:serine/threonine protein kinase